MILLDGKSLAKLREQQLFDRVQKLKQKLNFVPKLATIIVGDNSASQMYVKMKFKACIRVGLESQIIEVNENATTEQVIQLINQLNDDNSVCGILLQHPLPKHIDERQCFDAIKLSKDVDGVNSSSFGLMSMKSDAFVSATPLGIIKLLEYYNIELQGKNVLVIGRSAILGRPLAMQLINKDATVTVAHSKSVDIEKLTKNADVICVCVGVKNFLKPNMIKQGVVIVDAGYNKDNVGDVDAECSKLATAFTPVPGGVGPMTISALIEQTVISAERL